MNGMALDGLVDNTRGLSRCAGDKSEIDFSHRARGELFRKIAMGRVVLGYDERAAGFLVEPMHDPRPFLSADPGQIFAMGEERVDERVLLMAGAWVHYESGRFVKDEEIIVLEENVERYRLGLRVAPLNFGLAHFDDVIGPDSIPRPCRLPVQSYESIADQCLQSGAGKSRECKGQRAVEALPGLIA